MADIDEDAMPRGGQGPADDVDLSDETQDFRFLTSISREDAVVPKRGEKDFEPHSTALQSNTLAASRQAMHNALSFQRQHQPKSQVIATYHPETNTAYCMNPRGPMFGKMGHVKSAKEDPFGGEDRGQRLWLLPEEVLYLLERGTLDVRWPAEEGETGLPMSLQGAYAMFLGDEESLNGALTFERFSVYSGLKRMGYTVMRAPSWGTAGPPIGEECHPPPSSSKPQQTWKAGLFGTTSFWKIIFPSPKEPKLDDARGSEGPLVANGFYSNYESIYTRLALINFHDPTTHHPPQEPETDSNFRITFHVWKPNNTTFKKSAPGTPDFRIAVIDARSTNAPTLQQLGALMDTTPWDSPKQDGHFYPRLKYGYKNVILAVVDQGVTSYLRLGDAGFGREKMFERRPRKQGGGGKRGGGRGGRGGGRGRGGRGEGMTREA